MQKVVIRRLVIVFLHAVIKYGSKPTTQAPERHSLPLRHTLTQTNKRSFIPAPLTHKKKHHSRRKSCPIICLLKRSFDNHLSEGKICRCADVDENKGHSSHTISHNSRWIQKWDLQLYYTVFNFFIDFCLDEKLQNKVRLQAVKSQEWSQQVRLGSRHKAEEVMEVGNLLQKLRTRSLISSVTVRRCLFYHLFYQMRC